MEKYLVKIEFRYSDAPETEDGLTSKTKTNAIYSFYPRMTFLPVSWAQQLPDATDAAPNPVTFD